MNGFAKVIYTSPLKSLSNEKYNDWKDAYSEHGVVQLTGDTLWDQKERAKQMKRCFDAGIIIMTSELLDSLTRNFQNEKATWMLDVRLIIIDETHIISTNRGHAVEVGMMRFADLNPLARILCLSATLPNVEDFKQWLHTLNGKRTEVINSSWRPTKLNWHYVPHSSTGSYYAVQSAKMQEALNIVQKRNTEKFLVFVHDKTTGRKLVTMFKHNGIDTVFHNADLNFKDRQEIEQSFADKEKGLRVLIATSTLAWGVNVNAKNVVIVGTTRGIKDVDELDVMQEAGRAGRSFPPKYIVVTPEANEYKPSTLDNLSLAITSDMDSLHGRASTIVKI